MSKIVIRPGRKEDVEQVYVFMNEQKETLPYLGGFSSKGQYEGYFVKGNELSDRNLVAVDGDEVVGCSLSKDRGHYTEQDYNAVIVDRRREGIGSHLYMAHRWRSMLEGKLFIHDQIIDFNPHMPFFLDFLNFDRISHIRQKIRNFSGLYHYRYDLLEEELAKNTFKSDKFEIQMEEREFYEKSFTTNIAKLSKRDGDEKRVGLLYRNRELARSGEWAL